MAKTWKKIASGLTPSNNRIEFTTDKLSPFAFIAPINYSITTSLTNVTGASGNPSTVAQGGTATLTFSAASGYALPDTITVSGAAYTWTKSTGVVVLSNPTGAVTITIAGIVEASGGFYAAKSDGLYSSTDGSSWTNVGAPTGYPFIQSVFSDGVDRLLVSASDSQWSSNTGTFITSDGGATYSTVELSSSGYTTFGTEGNFFILKNNIAYVIASGSTTLVAISNAPTIGTSLSWVKTSASQYPTLCDWDNKKSYPIIASGSTFAFDTTNVGTITDSVYLSDSGVTALLNNNASISVIKASDSSYKGHIFYSTDAFTTATEITVPSDKDFNECYSYAVNGTKLAFFGSYCSFGGIYDISTATWTWFSFSGIPAFSSCAQIAMNDTKVLCMGTSGVTVTNIIATNTTTFVTGTGVTNGLLYQ